MKKLRETAGDGTDIQRLEQLGLFIKDAGVSEGIVLDTSITRGLDYYTGVVFETFLDKLPGIGSVCSGGRYDNLAALYSKEQIPGVGSSIGLDRLQAALEELDQNKSGGRYADAAVSCLSAENTGKAQKTAEDFRREGINCEVFFDAKKVSEHYIAAEKKSIPWVIIPDYDSGKFTVRNIAARESRENIDLIAAVNIIKG